MNCGQFVSYSEVATGKWDRNPRNLLSPREYEVFMLLVKGMRVTHIAKKLCRAVATITTHREHICQKLGVNDTVGIVLYAYMGNWVQPSADNKRLEAKFPEQLTTEELLAIVNGGGYTLREKRIARTCLGLLDRLIAQGK